jgi:hypothetical protein
LLALFNAGPENVFEVAANQGNLLFLGESEVKKLGLLAEHHSAILCDLADRFEAYKVYMANETPAEEQPAEIDPDDETPAGKKRKKTAKKAAFSHHPTSAELKKIKESISKELSSTVPGDVALFGRMMASLIETNVDGAVQVASAVSVNPIGRTKGVDGWYNGEVDFFAAVDDRKCGDDAGAGMIGETNFATPTYYRYANIAVADVVESVGDKVVAMAAIKAFVEGFVKSCPSGYSHQFAHHTLPEMVLLEAYDHPPISLWSAFTAPIENIDKSIVTDRSGLSVSQQAAERLMSQRQELYEMYGYAVAAEAVTALRDHYPDGVTLDKAIDSVLAAVV